MAARASTFWPRGANHVLRMIEFHVEAFFERVGKGFSWRIVSVDTLMTDRAHRKYGRGELRQVAAGAIFVTRKDRPGRVIVPMMTILAGDCSMFGTRMKKF